MPERAIVLLVAAIQFVNILDFMMVMPLGPDFSRALGIPLSRIGIIGGSYTFAAMVSGVLGSLFLDRFGRRAALVCAVLGLAGATAMGGLARGFGTLVAARLLAGLFGGPATSVSLSIIADTVPAERRGKAMGTVMGAFAASSVLGVPTGLELAQRGGWRLPFFAVGALGLLAALAAATRLPPLRGHLERTIPDPMGASYRAPQGTEVVNAPPPRTLDMLRRPTVGLAYAMSAMAMMGGFVLIPNISPYLIQNLGYPRERLGMLYLCGGLCSFVVLPIAGRLVDRFGSLPVAAPATVGLVAVLYAGYVRVPPPIPVLAVFVLFMIAMGFRNVAMQTVVTRVPNAAERARFNSLLSAVQHGASSAGAVLSTALLTEGANHTLRGMATVATISIALFLALPVLLAAVERRVRAAHAGPVVSSAS